MATALAVLLFPGFAAAHGGDDPATTWNFMAIGDWGADTTAQYAMAAGMNTVAGEIDAKQVFALGDNFYHSAKSGCPEGSGICNGGKDGPDGMNRFKTTFEDVYNGSNLLKIPFYAIAGNHDHGGNVSAQIAYATRTDRPTDRWTYDAWYYNVTQQITIPGGKTVELETLLFDSVIGLGNSDKVLEDGVVIELKGDELPGPDDPPSAEAQWEWLEGRMNSSTADYLWVGAHYPVWSVASHGPTAGLVERLRPMLHQHQAHFFNGHDHDLEHIKENGSAVNYVTTGSGMSCCYADSHLQSVPAGSTKFAMVGSHGAQFESMPFDMLSGFTTYRVGKDHMSVVFHAHNGTELYRTDPILPRDLSKSPGPLPPLPPPAPPPPPSPPSPPPAPPAPPAPTPTGMQWECHKGMGAVGLSSLKDVDNTKGFKTVTDCERGCNGIEGCTVVNWHQGDLHCHTLTGATTHDKFMASLKAQKSSTACMLVKGIGLATIV